MLRVSCFVKIKKGDTVLIISGKDKNKTGKVNNVLPKKDKVIVDGLNIVKKHRKARKSGEKGQIVEISRPIHVSNVKLMCPRCGQAARVGYKVTEKEKARMCKKCESEI